MKYKYKRGGYREAIERVEITRESEKCVWEKVRSGEHRHMKRSRSEIYYDTWEDAHADLLKHTISVFEHAKQRVIIAQETLDEVKAIKNPELAQQEATQ